MKPKIPPHFDRLMEAMSQNIPPPPPPGPTRPAPPAIKFRFDYQEDWEPNHCHWRAPSWLYMWDDGAITMGAGYLANMHRTDLVFDVGSPRDFGFEFELFDYQGTSLWRVRINLAYELHYKSFIENTAKRAPGSPGSMVFVRTAVRCTAQRYIDEHAISPGSAPIPIVDEPWEPKG